MKPSMKTVLVLAVALFAFTDVQTKEVSAQGPIIKRMRERLNGGKPLLPFVEDIESELKETARKLKPAKKPTPVTGKKPTDGKKPTPASSKNTKAPKKDVDKKFPKIRLESPGKGDKPPTVKPKMSDFGLVLEKVGEKFRVSRVAAGGNAAAAGLRRGDVIEGIGGAELIAIEEFAAIEKAMRGGDRVEFEFSRRGGKPEKAMVQYGQPDPEAEQSDIDVAPSLRSENQGRYEPDLGSGLRSVYEGSEATSSVLTPAPSKNRVESLKELDFPALDGGK